MSGLINISITQTLVMVRLFFSFQIDQGGNQTKPFTFNTVFEENCTQEKVLCQKYYQNYKGLLESFGNKNKSGGPECG